jgi:prevent-host-death family protein
LRNHTADLLRQVSKGAQITVTVNGTAVAEIIPVRATRRESISKRDLTILLTHHHADLGLRDELAALAGETKHDLDPIREALRKHGLLDTSVLSSPQRQDGPRYQRSARGGLHQRRDHCRTAGRVSLAAIGGPRIIRI